MSSHPYDTTEPLFAEEGSYTVEREGIEAAPIGIFVFALLIGLTCIVLLSTWWFQAEVDTAQATVNATARYPALQQTEITARQQLNRYEVLNREQGIYRIPLERAMELQAAEASPTGNFTRELDF